MEDILSILFGRKYVFEASKTFFEEYSNNNNNNKIKDLIGVNWPLEVT